ncbi:putative Heteroproteinous nuclear ribonucleoprotein U-like protein 1 [Heracleum sosnowskyi]|uniref:Heteroproteinous nuclear ribonucleoprotein U-like protein 1 n=1 Tax=Heracleum sosnowskyi TaxID=360622 RepID=A0AAD8HKW0_9APIA|nr:putative Heteroproteinous nuclear ribonucleoprotein U-like protein 1 [Heracleum sosnowskyi]
MELGKDQDLGFGYISLSRSWSFGRKRVFLSNNLEEVDSCFATPKKKYCGEDSFMSSEKSVIEALPQDILIRILCGVEHDDLKRLFYVSKSIRAATVIAKQWHFAYSTPTKKLIFKDPVKFENSDDAYELEAPNAPKQSRNSRSRLNGKNQGLLSRRLFMDMETGI